jgi:tetratricopeptide (TPR) repeat protein
MTMLAPLPSVEAFRRDAISIDGAELDDGMAAAWLESATRLERAAMTRGPERERLLGGLLARHDVVVFPDRPVASSAVFSMVTSIAADMEDQACFRLAHSMLSTLLLIIPENEEMLRGRAIALLGRFARHIGDLAASNRYYEQVEEIGVHSGVAELTGRAWVGYGILAQLRGDFPEARRRFNAAIELDGAAAESVGVAHHQLMVAAATAKDYDLAASHAWKAFKGASTCAQETEALVNLAQLLLVAGHSRASLRGFAAALAREPIYRFALPSLGGAACAAAAALPLPAARALVRNFSDRVDQIITALHNGRTMPFPSAAALTEVSEALAVIGDEERSSRLAARAEELATAHGFHEILYRLENPVHIAAPAPLAPATTEILAAVDELEGAELVGAAG